MAEGGSSDGVLGSQSCGGEQSRWEDERPHKTILPLVLSLSWSQEPYQRWSLLCQTLDAEQPWADWWQSALGGRREKWEYLLVWSSWCGVLRQESPQLAISCSGKCTVSCFKTASERVSSCSETSVWERNVRRRCVTLMVCLHVLACHMLTVVNSTSLITF